LITVAVSKTMHHQQFLRMIFAIGIFGSTFSTEVRAEIISRIPGDFGWRKSIPLQLILAKGVVEDLGFSAEVAGKLKQLHEQIQGEVEAERRKPTTDSSNAPAPDKRVRRYEWNDAILHTVRNRHTDELNALLTSQQQERLHQVHLQGQRKRTDALCDPGVANQLGLTATQRSEIYQRHWEVVKAEMDEVKQGTKYTGPSSSSLESACPETVMKILTEEQRQSFERLHGQPLKPSLK
jgi:hypothetical protein